jgi:hypothetical protein
MSGHGHTAATFGTAMLILFVASLATMLFFAVKGRRERALYQPLKEAKDGRSYQTETDLLCCEK